MFKQWLAPVASWRDTVDVVAIPVQVIDQGQSFAKAPHPYDLRQTAILIGMKGTPAADEATADRPHVVLAGAYERDNFGDLLYLLLAEEYFRSARG